MKKIILIPTILTIASTPLVSISGCNNEPKTVYHYVTFITNGGTPIEQAKVEHNKLLTPPKQPSKDHYQFDKWYTDESLTQEYTFSNPVLGDFTLYAGYIPTQYKINYHMAAGATQTNPTGYTTETETFELSNAFKKGYSFDGWHKDSPTGPLVSSISKGSSGDLELYTTESIINYDIEYVLNGGASKGDNPDTYTVEDNIYLKTAEWGNKPFKGWHLEEDLSNPAIRGWRAGAKTDKITLYAAWENEPTEYTITYKNVTHDEHPDDPETYTSESETIILSDAQRENWTFGGWYLDETFGERSKITEIPKGSAGNLVIYAKMIYQTTVLDDCSWEEISMISQLGGARATFGNIDGTQTKKVQLNHQDLNKNGKIDNGEYYQTVRIIGYDHDKDKDGNTLGITFEFTNLISDENGYSLALQWFDTNEFKETAGGFYNLSSIHHALGEENAYPHLWAQKKATSWSDKYKSDYDVLDMLPNDLLNQIKTSSKYVRIFDNDEKLEDTEINDKLFLLSPREIGYDIDYQESSDHTSTYEYYYGHTGQSDEIRSKAQLKPEENAQRSIIRYTEGSPQLYKGDVNNFAGYCASGKAYDYAGKYWLRSPNVGDYVWCVDFDNGSTTSRTPCDNAMSIAPAFCI